MLLGAIAHDIRGLNVHVLVNNMSFSDHKIPCLRRSKHLKMMKKTHKTQQDDAREIRDSGRSVSF